MQRIKRPPLRNKIDLADPAQVRVWSRRLRVPADALAAIVEKVGNSAAAVTKQVELHRLSRPPCPVQPFPVQPFPVPPVSFPLADPPTQG